MKKPSPYVLTIAVAVVVGAVAFFGGMKYQQRKFAVGMNGEFAVKTMGRNGQNVGFRQNAGNDNGIKNGGQQKIMMGQAPVSGEILSLADGKLTIKMDDGSSKIIILSAQTAVHKSTSIDQSELQVGTKVTVMGSINQDGSVTAQRVQLDEVTN